MSVFVYSSLSLLFPDPSVLVDHTILTLEELDSKSVHLDEGKASAVVNEK